MVSIRNANLDGLAEKLLLDPLGPESTISVLSVAIIWRHR